MKACIFHDMNPGQRDRKIFELVEHAHDTHGALLIYAPGRERAAAIDRFLWILKQESFIPHRIFEENGPDPGVAIGIVMLEINPVAARTLIADGRCSLDFACGFDTIHEFVDRSSPAAHEECRDRFRQYRERKIAVDHVKE